MRRGTRPVVFRERAGFQSNARLGGARSTGNLRVRGAWRGASSSEGGFSGVGGPFPGRFRGRAEREGEGLRVQMSASRRLRATFPHDSAVSREPGSIRMSSGPFSPGGVVRGSGSTCWRAGSTCWRGWPGAGWCVGLLGRSEAGACPNLLQRGSGPGSAARISAEYQRFASGASARFGPLQQIRTNGAVAGPCADGGPGDHPDPRSAPHRPTAPGEKALYDSGARAYRIAVAGSLSRRPVRARRGS